MKIHSFHHRLLRQRRFRQILVISLLFSLFISLIIVPIEQTSEKATITTISDGIWWTVQTATTVGYGDVTPVTTPGRILGIMLQILGTVMFGTLIAIISTSMGRNQEEMYWNRTFDRLDSITEKLDKLKNQTSYLVKNEASEEVDREYTS